MLNKFFSRIPGNEILWKKYGRAAEATDHSTIRRRKDAICMPDN
jgi:hypothetical protein